METSFQKIIAAVVGVMILFIIPVYIAFEKVDDVSYSLAVKLTQNFVDNVRNKGYISPDMYSDFVSGLHTTNNIYDVEIEHVKKRYDPAIYIYERLENNTKGELLHVLDYESYEEAYGKGEITINVATYDQVNSNIEVVDSTVTIKDLDSGNLITRYNINDLFIDTEDSDNIFVARESDDEEDNMVTQSITYVNGVNCIFEKAHVINEEIITDKQIVTKLFENTGVSKIEFLRQCMLGNGDMYNSLVYMNENSYIMNEDDQINVTVRNRNQTIASVFYSLLTANVGNEEVAKIYVDYGGTIKNNGSTILTEENTIVDGEYGRLFKYTGQAQEVTLSPGKYEIQCWGAAGGYPEDADLSKVGKGAYAKATFNITKEMTLYVYVGGQGSKYSETNEENGGYNGGGDAYNAFGGGGATDVRILRGDAEDTESLLTRIIVAAGGGGNSGNAIGYGGAGGSDNTTYNGKRAEGAPITGLGYMLLDETKVSEPAVGIGADINSGNVGYSKYIKDEGDISISGSISENEQGRFGIGGSVDFNGAGAGGGGYYGGSAAHDENSGGGGGLSYVYQNITNDGYPLNYNTKLSFSNILEKIKAYVTSDGKWDGIKFEDGEIKAGNEEMPSGLTFNGTTEMFGNSGNGYAIIKKVG